MVNAFTASGLFGELFCDPAIAAEFNADNFTKRILVFEAAWSHALGACGVVPIADATAAQAVIAGFQEADLGAGSNRDGLPVPALVTALKKGQSPNVAAAIHAGATSQDVIDTAMVLTCVAVIDRVCVQMAQIVARLDAILDKFGDAPLMARTRMQTALPATVALRVDAWRRPLAMHLQKADDLRKELSVVQIGGPIGLHSEVQCCAEKVANRLGLALAPVWHTDRTRFVQFGHWMSLVAGTLGKIGQDIALMAQQGVDEITLAGGGGSSAMAHKQNPIAAEAMISLARYVAGQQGILGQAMIHEQERSGAAWALEWLILPALAEAVGASLAQADRLLASVERIGTR